MGINNDLRILKNIVRIGIVSSINKKSRTARVEFTDKKNLVSGPLKIIRRSPLITIESKLEHTHDTITTSWIPNIGELVLCIYLPNGESDGFIIGGI